MTTLNSNRIRGSNVSDKWPSRTMDDYRKSSTIPSLGKNYSRDVHSNKLRPAVSKVYRQDCTSEQDMKFPQRASDETILDDEEANVNKNIHTSGTAHGKGMPKNGDEVLLDREHQCTGDYPEFNVSEAMMAMQKIGRLKELQRKRDLSERYYSQEIRRLIGEHFIGTRMAVPILKMNEKLKNAGLQPYPGNRPKNSLEPCGTMTTITRLDCGCIQETTRPIFTTAKGRVQKKCCSQSQDEVLLKLTSSNPQEHLFSSVEPHKERHCVKSKKRLSLNPRMYSEAPGELNRDVPIENNRRNNVQQSDAIGRNLRSASPVRKCSETSSISV